jgi:hypothetical protein
MKEKLKDILHHILLFFRRPKYDAKVFCIGYNKTGTTTLGKSLEMLGYRNSSFNKKVWRKYYKNNEIEKILLYTSKFDSFDDLPWLKEDMIPVLDKKFPGSKFIYLERDEVSWKKSFNDWTFNMTGKYPNIEEGWQDYLKHQKFVLDYFKERKSDFIVINVKDENGLKKTADFLGKTTIQNHFPHFNKTTR